jgi:D-alanine-D-alanine ligase
VIEPDKIPLTRRLRVAVLMGGTSSEREVSLVSGRMIAEALDPDCYEVTALDTRDLLGLTSVAAKQLPAAAEYAAKSDADITELTPAALEASLTASASGQMERPDVVFIALHGKGGEDGTVQGLLELLRLPYTGSGVLASALAMDKVMSKRVFKAAGIPVIDGIFVTRAKLADCTEEEFRQASLREVEATLGFPVFVKPNAGGSTCGCSLVSGAEDLFRAVHEALQFDEIALIEKYVRGTEITIGVVDFADEPVTALPVIEIVPKGEYYDYESKYSAGGSEHIIPARLPERLLKQARQIAVQCHELLGCRAVSRTDIIVSNDELYVLEVNTIPGMTPTSLLPQAAEYAGISFPQLLDRIIQAAIR